MLCCGCQCIIASLLFWQDHATAACKGFALRRFVHDVQVQAELGPGHINLINVYELILSDDYLGLVMEYAQGGSLTAHVAERWGTATAGKLVMDEDEARYFFRVSILINLCGLSKPPQGLACSAATEAKDMLCHEHAADCLTTDAECRVGAESVYHVCAAIHSRCGLLPQAQHHTQVREGRWELFTHDCQVHHGIIVLHNDAVKRACECIERAWPGIASESSPSPSVGKQVVKRYCVCRDLKLDNTLLDGQKPPFLKICDFGFASHFDAKLTEHLG